MSCLPSRMINDIRSYCDDNPRQYVEFGELMTLENVLKAYFEYNGVIGYTSDMMTLFLAARRLK